MLYVKNREVVTESILESSCTLSVRNHSYVLLSMTIVLSSPTTLDASQDL